MTAGFGLSAKDIKLITGVFSNYPVIDSVLIYGSRAMGRHREGSDIDLTIRGSVNRPVLSRISQDLDDLLLPYKFDLSIFDEISDREVLDHIHRVGQIFYQ